MPWRPRNRRGAVRDLDANVIATVFGPARLHANAVAEAHVHHGRVFCLLARAVSAEIAWSALGSAAALGSLAPGYAANVKKTGKLEKCTQTWLDPLQLKSERALIVRKPCFFPAI